MPVGSILWFANTTTTPPGWLAADGSAVSRTTYATLFASIGTTYGSGDGSTTFNVPSVAATTGKYFIRYTTSLGTVTTTSLSTAPVGTMLDWPTTSSYPTGYLRADGSAVSRTSYADLFALIGTTYGVGDNSTTFNLPNLVAAGTGSPVKIIKASLGGTVEPSTVAHASSHIRGGSDIIDADRAQIDFVPTRYIRDSSASEAGANTDLTAHLKGIDNSLSFIKMTPTSVSGSGASINSNGSVTLNAITQVTLNNVFSSSYRNYKIILEGVGTSWSGISGQFTSGGTATTSNYGYRVNYTTFSGGPFVSGSNATSSFYLGTSGNLISAMTHTIYTPASTLRKATTGEYTALDGSYNEGGTVWSWLNSTSSHDGLKIIIGAGTFTGVVTIHGYN